MTDETLERRGPGRPRKTETEPNTTEAQAAVPPSQRRRRASTGGFRQKLDAPQRAGFVRRWVDNDPSRIMAMEELGYTMVADRAGDGASRTDGLGTRMTRHAGKRDDGSPQHVVLMECSQADYDLGIQDKEAALKPFEEAINRGEDTTGRVNDGYKTRDRSGVSHERA